MAETEAVGAGVDVLVAVDLLVGVVGTAERLAVAEAGAVLAVALPVGVPLVAVAGAGTEELGVAPGLVDVPELGGVVTEGLGVAGVVCFASMVERKTGLPARGTAPLLPARRPSRSARVGTGVYLASGHHATASMPTTAAVPRTKPVRLGPLPAEVAHALAAIVVNSRAKVQPRPAMGMMRNTS
ncbi:MAG: hypothetical protein ACR2JN_10080 [Lapillicoccus sp.]